MNVYARDSSPPSRHQPTKLPRNTLPRHPKKATQISKPIRQAPGQSTKPDPYITYIPIPRERYIYIYIFSKTLCYPICYPYIAFLPSGISSQNHRPRKGKPLQPFFLAMPADAWAAGVLAHFCNAGHCLPYWGLVGNKGI